MVEKSNKKPDFKKRKSNALVKLIQKRDKYSMVEKQKQQK